MKKIYKLLVVDDDRNFLNVMDAMLKDETRLEVKLENEPLKALEILKQEKYDILFVDYYMPQMTGEQLVKKLREFDKDIFVILQTGYSGNKPATEMLEIMNIQGYYDKSEKFEKFELLLKSIIKTLDLIEEVKRKDLEIDYMTYKDNVMGNLTVEISDGLKNQITAIDIAMKILEGENVRKIKEVLPTITSVNNKMKELLGALNFATNKEHEFLKVIENVKILTRNKIKVSEAKLNINMLKNAFLEIDSTILTLVFIKLITLLLDEGIKEIDITTEIVEGEVNIIVNNVDESISQVLNEISIPEEYKIKSCYYDKSNLKIIFTKI